MNLHLAFFFIIPQIFSVLLAGVCSAPRKQKKIIKAGISFFKTEQASIHKYLYKGSRGTLFVSATEDLKTFRIYHNKK